MIAPSISRTVVVALALTFCASAPRAQIAGNSKSPIDITANEAEVVNSKCLAIWRGAAEALQDKTRLRADTISVYSHLKGAKGKSGATIGQPDCGATDRIEAEGHVYYVNPDQNARADRAVYTAASDQIVMTGDVIVVQGADVARGERLVLNVNTHEARMQSGGAGRRVRAVIYPDKAATADTPTPR